MNIQISQGSAVTDFRRRFIVYQLLLQFVSECKSE